MRLSILISKLQDIKAEFGDIAVTGGILMDDTPLRKVLVTDKDGVECWPGGEGNRSQIDGVFLEM